MKYNKHICFPGKGEEGHCWFLLALLVPWILVLDCLLLTQFHFLPSIPFLYCRLCQPGSCLSQNSCHKGFSLGSVVSWNLESRWETEAILLVLWQQWTDTWTSAERRILQWFQSVFFFKKCLHWGWAVHHGQCFLWFLELPNPKASWISKIPNPRISKDLCRPLFPQTPFQQFHKH